MVVVVARRAGRWRNGVQERGRCSLGSPRKVPRLTVAVRKSGRTFRTLTICTALVASQMRFARVGDASHCADEPRNFGSCSAWKSLRSTWPGESCFNGGPAAFANARAAPLALPYDASSALTSADNPDAASRHLTRVLAGSGQ